MKGQVEVFHHPDDYDLNQELPFHEWYKSGWYYWYCFLGCLPDSDPYGPFESEQTAIDTSESEE